MAVFSSEISEGNLLEYAEKFSFYCCSTEIKHFGVRIKAKLYNLDKRQKWSNNTKLVYM